MIGGTVVIVGFLTIATGGTLAVQGYSSLGNIGIEALTGFLAAFINVRISAPVVAGIGLAATFGAGVTAQLGAMRVNQEIDALESMAIRPIAFLVSTRIVAGMIAITPLYAIAVILSFLASKFTTVTLLGQSQGLYDHYFSTFLNPIDLLWSFVQAVLMALCSPVDPHLLRLLRPGGPAGVGVATGDAVRTSPWWSSRSRCWSRSPSTEPTAGSTWLASGSGAAEGAVSPEVLGGGLAVALQAGPFGVRLGDGDE